MRRIVLCLFLGLAFGSAGFQPTNVPNGLGVGEAIRPYNDGQVTYNLDIECDNLEVGTMNVSDLSVSTIDATYIDMGSAGEIKIGYDNSALGQLLFGGSKTSQITGGSNQPAYIYTTNGGGSSLFNSAGNIILDAPSFGGSIGFISGGEVVGGINSSGLSLLSGNILSLQSGFYTYQIGSSPDDYFYIKQSTAGNIIEGSPSNVSINVPLYISGNITSAQLETGTISANSLTVAGVITANQVNATNLTGTLQTVAQTNITSLGTLTSLNVGGGTPTVSKSLNVFANMNIGAGANSATLVFDDGNAGTSSKLMQMVMNDGLFKIQSTTDTGSGAVDAISIDKSSGNSISSISFGNATNNPAFSFLGTGATTFAGAVSGITGTASSPAYSFTGATNYGFYKDGTNLCMSNNGTRSLIIGTTYITAGNGGTGTASIYYTTGSASVPQFTFSGDSDSGLFRSGANTIGLATGGTAGLTIDSSQNVGIAENLNVGGDVRTVPWTTDTNMVVTGNGTITVSGATYVLREYKKVGDIVYIRFDVTNITLGGTNSTYLILDNLPYDRIDNDGDSHPIQYRLGGTNYMGMALADGANLDSLALVKYDSSNLGLTSCQVRGCFWYRTSE